MNTQYGLAIPHKVTKGHLLLGTYDTEMTEAILGEPVICLQMSE